MASTVGNPTHKAATSGKNQQSFVIWALKRNVCIHKRAILQMRRSFLYLRRAPEPVSPAPLKPKHSHSANAALGKRLNPQSLLDSRHNIEECFYSRDLHARHLENVHTPHCYNLVSGCKSDGFEVACVGRRDLPRDDTTATRLGKTNRFSNTVGKVRKRSQDALAELSHGSPAYCRTKKHCRIVPNHGFIEMTDESVHISLVPGPDKVIDQ